MGRGRAYGGITSPRRDTTGVGGQGLPHVYYFMIASAVMEQILQDCTLCCGRGIGHHVPEELEGLVLPVDPYGGVVPRPSGSGVRLLGISAHDVPPLSPLNLFLLVEEVASIVRL